MPAFHGYQGIIISGSPALSSHGEEQDYTKEIYDLDIPILGFCFGHQEIAKHYGGEVVHGGREWGKADLQIQGEHPLFSGLDPSERVWMSHYDSVASVGPEFQELGYSLTGGGEHRYAAIGSDFDGIGNLPEGLADVSGYPILLGELLARGWTRSDISKVAGLNVLRVMRGAEAAAAELQRTEAPAEMLFEKVDPSH